MSENHESAFLINILENLLESAKLCNEDNINYFLIKLDLYIHFYPELTSFIIRIKNELNKEYVVLLD